MIDNGSEEEIMDAIIKVYNDKDLYNSIKKVSLEKGSDHFSYYKIAERSIKV